MKNGKKMLGKKESGVFRMRGWSQVQLYSRAFHGGFFEGYLDGME